MTELLTLERLEREIQKLPPLPVTVVEVLAALQDDNSDYDQLQTILSKDSALAARVLGVANSPFYGFAGQISSLKEACVVLGVNTTCNIVLTAGVIGQFPAGRACNLDLAALWQHALATAAAGKILAPLVKLDGDSVFTAGLLHDIGKMVLDVYFGEAYEAVLTFRDAEDCLLREAEQAELGFDHSLVGARVAARWKLPTIIVDAIAGHHLGDPSIGSPIGQLIHVADIVARGLGIGDGGDSLIPALSPETLDNLGLSLSALADHLPEIEKLSEAGSQFMR